MEEEKALGRTARSGRPSRMGEMVSGLVLPPRVRTALLDKHRQTLRCSFSASSLWRRIRKGIWRRLLHQIHIPGRSDPHLICHPKEPSSPSEAVEHTQAGASSSPSRRVTRRHS